MKIIEALKKTKDLLRKADDIVSKIAQYCADLDCETPTYKDQAEQVTEWLQAHSDIMKEVLHLRFSIQRTNIETLVTIELGGRQVTKSIAEWIHRRKDLAKLEEACWKKLSDKGYNETYTNKLTVNAPPTTIKRRLYFDPKERDKKIELYRSEPSIIDATLETINAVTTLIEK